MAPVQPKDVVQSVHLNESLDDYRAVSRDGNDNTRPGPRSGHRGLDLIRFGDNDERVRRLQRAHVHLVTMHNALTTADLVDGVRPNAGGDNTMAATWFGALRVAPRRHRQPGDGGGMTQDRESRPGMTFMGEKGLAAVWRDRAGWLSRPGCVICLVIGPGRGQSQE